MLVSMHRSARQLAPRLNGVCLPKANYNLAMLQKPNRQRKDWKPFSAAVNEPDTPCLYSMWLIELNGWLSRLYVQLEPTKIGTSFTKTLKLHTYYRGTHP